MDARSDAGLESWTSGGRKQSLVRDMMITIVEQAILKIPITGFV